MFGLSKITNDDGHNYVFTIVIAIALHEAVKVRMDAMLQ